MPSRRVTSSRTTPRRSETTLKGAARSWGAYRQDAGASQTISAGRASFWHHLRRIIFMVSSCPWMVDGWRAEESEEVQMSRINQPFALDAQLDWEAAGEGIRRKILTYNEGVMMVRVAFEAGAVGVAHSHPH